MAANDYFRDDHLQNPSSHHQQGYSPYQPSPSPMSSYPPSYTSEQPLNRPGAAPSKPPALSTSPFETPFDDHVYPTNSNHAGAGMSQSSFAQDTRYQGAHVGNISPVGDDIPLQGGQPKMGGSGLDFSQTGDHVYDQSQAPRGDKPRGRLQMGEMGMLGSGKRRIPIFVYLFSAIQIGVFIAELVKAAQLTGTPIQTQPSFNPMVGPSQYVLINMGSRYVACMHNVPAIQGSNVTITWPCPYSTSSDTNDASNKCTLSELCGFNGVPEPLYHGDQNQNPQPNQWWRFIIPIFMHAGFIHIGFNLLLQLTMGKDIERAIGSIRFFLVYMSSGIFGFIMGGNFAATGISSTGASGALFGIIAITLLDLLYSWRDRRNPVRELMFIIIEILVSFVLGLLPGLDNFSHIGGFLMGLCLGVCILHSPNALRRKIGTENFAGAYSSVNGEVQNAAFPPFYRNPIGFFKGRNGLWWAWWLVRAACLVTIIVVFFVLLNNFYVNHNTCEWCKYLSCLPVSNWCDVGTISITTTTASVASATPTPTHA